MSKAIETVEDVDIDLEDLDLEEVEVAEVDVIEAEIKTAAKAPKEKKEKKEKAPKGEGLASTKKLAEDEIGAADVAALLGITSRELRMFLRKHYRNMETEKSQRYVWKKGDAQVQAIVDAFKAAKAAPRAKKEKPVTEPAK